MVEAYYPVFIKIEGKNCVVVGGGRVAERKIKTLLKYNATVRVISPTLTAALQKMAEKGIIEWAARPYVKGDLEGAFMVIAASNVPEINQAVYEEAEGRGLLVNVVDKPSLCRFIVPAAINSDGITLAFSSGGSSPAVIKKLQMEIKGIMPKYIRLLKLVSQIRKNYVGKNLKPQAWREALDSRLETLLEEGKMEEARKLLDKRLKAHLQE